MDDTSVNTTRRSFSVREFCARHQISKPTALKEIHEGRLRTFRVGKLYRITPEAEAEWITDREREASAA
ncbi:MAG: excisionase family DNA-binding protein [Pseudomonadales bacterium]